jgi:hypothetical protein
MLLKNIVRQKVDSAVDGMPKLDNYFATKKPKKGAAMKIKIGPYGGIGAYADNSSDGDSDGASGDGGGGE